MRWLVVALWSCGGCSLFLGSDDEPSGGDGSPSHADGSADGTAAHQSWRFDVQPDRLDGDWTAGSGCVIDTGVRSANGCNFPGDTTTENDTFTLWADTVQVIDVVSIVGDRPLVIAARSIRVASAGVIDVAGQVPDGGVPHCTGVPNGTLSRGASGGGFGTAGAPGGGSGADGGEAVPLTRLSGVAIGCPGGKAGMSAAGGGGVQLIATERLEVDGAIFAHGASGLGGLMVTGGGGGGSGGMIVLDSASIAVGPEASIAANGGAGGSGGDASTGNPGMTASGFACSTGGLPTSGSGAGGAGACADNAAIRGGDGGMSTGDGGGGGGLGYVLIHGDAEIASAMISPPPMVAPDP